MQSDLDKNLLDYFTDVEYLRGAFKEYVAAPTLPKHMIVIHGVGGVGKSSLLRMFRIHCKSEKIPVALASGDDTKSVLDVLTRWMEDLKEDGIRFASLGQTLESYRAIQAKVNEQAKKVQDARGRMADIAGKAVSKTAETAGGALMGAAIGSVIPVFGTAIGGVLGGALGGMSAEAMVDWLRGFLTKPDIDLLLDPSKKLTSNFLEDLAKAVEKHRIVLMLDTFEQMNALDDWARDVAQRIHPNVLLVIAGRKLPDWNRLWQEWMINAQVEELKPMTEDIMRQLIRRYYATMRGGEPNPAQEEAIIHFARGLPMVITSAVQLWVKYGVEDFQSVKAEIVANLVDSLMDGVPSALIPALEAAAVVRWFDQPILRAVTGLEDVRNVYNELRRFPFVRTRVEGLALHDSVREMMDENLRVQDSERHSELHERAAMYFEKRLEKTMGEEAERFGMERLYHHIRADEEAGTKLFKEMAEELTQYRLVNRLRALLSDIQTYTIHNSKLHTWLFFYNARLAHLEKRFEYATREYRRLIDDKNINVLIINECRSSSMCYLAMILSRRDSLWISKNPQQVLDLIKDSDSLLSDGHPLRINNLVTRGVMELRLGNMDFSRKYFQEAIDQFKIKKDVYGVVGVYRLMMEGYALQGNWKSLIAAYQSCLISIPQNTPLYKEANGEWAIAWVWMGKYSEAAERLRSRIEAQEQFGEIGIYEPLCALGYSLGMQGRYLDAYQKVSDANTKYCALSKENYYLRSLVFEAFILIQQGKWEESQATMRRLWTEHNEDFVLRFYEKPEWYGLIYQNKQEWDQAERHYRLFLDDGSYPTGRYYFRCSALTGLIHVKYAQGDDAAIPPLLAEAEQIAQQYEYNDHLASLRLTQGHLAWETGKNDEALSYYRHAMLYALRYNRFLLDELLSGRPQGTPLRPIIPYCLERSKEGKKILIALRDWWKTGVNDIGTPRPDTISPIPEGISLLEAEKIAREREPGDGSIQKSMLEQIEAVL